MGLKLNSFNLIALRSERQIPNRVARLVGGLGKIIFNCGLLELLSKNWIEEVEQVELERKKQCNQLWNEKSKKLKQLIKEKLNADLTPKLIQVIDDAADLMKFRNSVAHGSLVENDDGKIVLYDSRRTLQFPDGRAIRLHEINDKIDQCADLFDEWNRLWNEYKTQSDRMGNKGQVRHEY